MKWFQHDTDALYDAKIKKLIFREGPEGYAVYFHCVELIAGTITKSNINFELEHDAEIIADNLKIKGDAEFSAIDKVNRIMKTIINLGLFEEVENRIFCFKLAKRLDNTVSRSPEIMNIKENINKSVVTTDILRSNNVLEEIKKDKNKLNESRLNKDKIDNNKKYVPLAQLLYNEHKKIDSNFLSGKNLDSTFNRWANDIRLLIENDKRSYETVEKVIIWCQSISDFWPPNILSGKKLREKFDTLLGQYNRNNKSVENIILTPFEEKIEESFLYIVGHFADHLKERKAIKEISSWINNLKLDDNIDFIKRFLDCYYKLVNESHDKIFKGKSFLPSAITYPIFNMIKSKMENEYKPISEEDKERITEAIKAIRMKV